MIRSIEKSSMKLSVDDAEEPLFFGLKKELRTCGVYPQKGGECDCFYSDGESKSEVAPALDKMDPATDCVMVLATER